ncbi:hypothetical protein ABT008_07580 [Micromonospora sp. NPDC002389]|uniref:hypothetical protein n=1 Tax=Micromonospora sp. NPDC002389 TaxID=3154272 RepID=UPI0033192FAB
MQDEYRQAAGVAHVLPGPAVAPGTQGAAIDWWLRFLIDPAPSVGLAAAGLRSGRAPCLRAGAELLGELGAIDHHTRQLASVEPARFAHRDDEWWARVSYALALLAELYRAPRVDGSRLMRLNPDDGAAQLLALANADEVADLVAMRDLAVKRLLPALPPGQVVSGPTFEGSADLNADADLIVGGLLMDFKASQGGRPRSDGTRAAALSRADLDQLLGYVLLDYSDGFRLDAVAIYAVRFGHFQTWPLRELCTRMAGHPVDLALLRKQFAVLLRR